MGNDRCIKEAELIIKKISNLLTMKNRESLSKTPEEKQQELAKDDLTSI